jgi:signal transduction histidine kinase
MAAAVAILALSTNLLFSESPQLNMFSYGAVMFIWLLEVTFLSSCIVAAFRSHNKIREYLEELEQTLGGKGLSDSVTTSESLILNRELANFLHGNLQNRLLSAALRMDKNQDNPEVLLRELKVVEELLDSAMLNYQETSALGLAEQLAEISSRWSGFVLVQFDLQTEIFSAGQVKNVAQLVNEAISNAVRHGLASKVWVSVAASPMGGAGAGSAVRWPELLITVTDDGLGPRSGVAGLGSNLFDSLAGTNWQLGAGADGGSVLTLAVS